MEIVDHIEAPTFRKVLEACKKPHTYVTVTVHKGQQAPCRVEVKGNVALIDIDLIKLDARFSPEARRRFLDKHDSYFQRKKKTLKGTKPGFTIKFGPIAFRVPVHVDDAHTWFEDIYQALLDPANITPIPHISDSIRRLVDELEEPKVKPVPPADPPEVHALKSSLNELQLPNQPRTPETIRKIQRVYKAYERPGAITRFVKRSRGSTCQLCKFEGFRTRRGHLYCEVHHLFHLSTNPPANCLAPEYLVVLCATCHRRMHYANVGIPTREASGWRVNVDDEDVLFEFPSE
jgi:5-methylcytosine-specific restriction endonuclease McrA